MRIPVKRNVNYQYYIPKNIAAVVGELADAIPNSNCLVLCPRGTHPKRLLESLAVIQHDLENQIKQEREEHRLRNKVGE